MVKAANENQKEVKARIKAKALRDYRRGDTLEEIGTRYGFEPSTISCWAARAKIPRRRRGCRKKNWPDETQIEIVNAVRKIVDGKPTLDEIGVQWHMCRANVHRIYRRWKNWKPRPPFKVGDIVRLIGSDYEVLEPDVFRGRVRDIKTGAVKTISWRERRHMAVLLRRPRRATAEPSLDAEPDVLPVCQNE